MAVCVQEKSRGAMTDLNASVELWVETVRHSSVWLKPETPKTVEILRSVFVGELNTDIAAQAVASLCNPLLQQGLSGPVFQLWQLMCEAIRMLGYSSEVNERHINLINAISRLPDVTGQDGKPVKAQYGWSGVFWRDMPCFAVEIRETAFGMLLPCTHLNLFV